METLIIMALVIAGALIERRRRKGDLL